MIVQAVQCDECGLLALWASEAERWGFPFGSDVHYCPPCVLARDAREESRAHHGRKMDHYRQQREERTDDAR